MLSEICDNFNLVCSNVNLDIKIFLYSGHLITRLVWFLNDYNYPVVECLVIMTNQNVFTNIRKLIQFSKGKAKMTAISYQV